VKTTNIFIKTSEPLDQVAGAIGEALGVEFAKQSSNGEVFFEASDDIETISVYLNDYEDLPDLPLSQYHACVEIVGYYGDTRRLQRARALFNSLKELKRFSILLADNADVRLDEYEPVKP